MNEQLEIEFKILLTKELFHQILLDYQNKIKKDYIQINHYLTHPILQEKKYMLRIREKDHQYEMTLKRPYQGHRLETNLFISKEEKDQIINHQMIDNEIIDILKKEKINPLELQQQFSLQTHRYDIQLEEGILSLDYNSYLNQEDYELEFETLDEEKGFLQFQEIIHHYRLDYQNNTPSKVQRALKAFKKNS